MLHKTWDSESASYRVVFDLPADLDVAGAAVVGDFNDWSPDAHVMTRAEDGRLERAVEFSPGQRVRFRYRIDGERWENDWDADDYVPNDHGGDDSVLIVPEAPPAADGNATGAGRAAEKKAAKRAAPTKKAAPAKKSAAKKSPAKKSAAKKSTGPKNKAPDA